MLIILSIRGPCTNLLLLRPFTHSAVLDYPYDSIKCSHSNYLHGAESFLRSRQLRSYSRISQHFMEPQGSLPRLLEPSTCAGVQLMQRCLIMRQRMEDVRREGPGGGGVLYHNPILRSRAETRSEPSHDKAHTQLTS
jgi:hypothetical protein